MKKLIDSIVNYLEIGNHPSVVSMSDDGLPELFGLLTKSASAQANFIFCPVSYQYITELSSNVIEQAINHQLALDKDTPNSITEVVQLDKSLVVIMDDLDLVDNYVAAASAADALVKKYRGKLLFVYIVENPLMVNKLKSSVWSYSSTQDAFIYHMVGQDWSLEELTQVCIDQFKAELNKSQLEKIATESGNHYGMFKRLYRDTVLGSSQSELYVDSLLTDFSTNEINTFKKILLKKKLSIAEDEVAKAYQKVNFINDKQEITIPFIAKRLLGFRIKDKVSLDPNSKKLTGLDLDLLTPTEKKIVEYLMINIGEEVTKSEIAEVVWEEDLAEKYSDWALDQRMSRLKRKLSDLGFDIDIETVYGKGYKLTKN